MDSAFKLLAGGTSFAHRGLKKEGKEGKGGKGGKEAKKPSHSLPLDLDAEAEGSEGEAGTMDEHAEPAGPTPKVKLTGEEPPDLITSYAQLKSLHTVPSWLNANLTRHGFSRPTPIQTAGWPILLEKHDMIGCAPTGSGKTLAFLIPVLMRGKKTVILEPTRELVAQVHKVAAELSRDSGLVVSTDADAAWDVLITTPLALVHATAARTARVLVLDEADKLMDASFLEQTDAIITRLKPRQIALFSATIPASVEETARGIMRGGGLDCVRAIVGVQNTAARSIDQRLVFCGNDEDHKLQVLRTMLASGEFVPPVLIFVQSVDRAKQLYQELLTARVRVESLHSERPPAERQRAIEQFNSGKVWCLISTDIAARGLDFKHVNLVLNYDFPQSGPTYIHRIGRSGRHTDAGKAITFFTKDDAKYLKILVNVMRGVGCPVPDYMLELRNPSQNEKHKLIKKPIARKDIRPTKSKKRAIKSKKESERAAKKSKADESEASSED